MPVAKRMPWKSFKEKHKSCTACDLCKERSKVLLYRGAWDADVLFIDESPNNFADAVGTVMGDSYGQLLDHILEQSNLSSKSIGYSYLVCCKSEGSPKKPEIKACSSRFMQMIHAVRPKVVVGLGKQSYAGLMVALDPERYQIHQMAHPGVIMRAGDVQQHVMKSKSLGLMNDINYWLDENDG